MISVVLFIPSTNGLCYKSFSPWYFCSKIHNMRYWHYRQVTHKTNHALTCPLSSVIQATNVHISLPNRQSQLSFLNNDNYTQIKIYWNINLILTQYVFQNGSWHHLLTNIFNEDSNLRSSCSLRPNSMTCLGMLP